MSSGGLFRKLRIAVLLYVLLFVAVASWLSRSAATDWEDTLYVNIYPIKGEDNPVVAEYLETLQADAFRPMERFLEREAQRYGVTLASPLEIALGPTLDIAPPSAGDRPGWLQVAIWSLRARWWAWRATRNDALPTPDVRLFVSYFTPAEGIVLDPSVGLQKGLIGFVNAFADRRMNGSNNVVITHELLHTLGALDKYDAVTTQPVFPVGYAEPEREPLYPQTRAEIMAGRIPLSPVEAVVPETLADTVIGPFTAVEIRLREPDGP